MASGSKKYTLRTSDNEMFEVEEDVAMQCQTLRQMIDSVSTDDDVVIPLPNVNSKIMVMVIMYCKRHIPSTKSSSEEDNKSSEDEIKNWDKYFMNIDQATLLDLIQAADYMDIEGLLDLTCQTVTNMLKGKTPDKIRETFKIESDFTPAEEEEIRKENQWVFE